MHYGTGIFYGYREEAPVDNRPPRLRPQGSVNPMKLSPLFMASIVIPGYDYFARNGMAPEEFDPVWIPLDWQCRSASWTLRGGPLQVQISYDGETVGDVRTLRCSTRSLDSFVAYRVREYIPGTAVWYQLLAII